MRLEVFKEQMRVNRGRLTSMDAELEDMFTYGTESFREFCLTTKCLGVKNLAWVATFLDAEQQNKFIEWYHKTNPKKLEIQTKLMEY